ncbi:MAG: hypothetical protein FJ128_13465 [Deltaproteobacteria bacterium]|nr:hypothetical protein [Deltaproteobacteria bacterium]
MRQIPMMQTASFIVALVISFSVLKYVSFDKILLWNSMVFFIVILRIYAYYRFNRVSHESFAGEYWQNIFLFMAFLSGIFWGLSAFLIFPAGSVELIAIIILVIASLSAATTVCHSSVRYGPTVWVGPAMSLYGVRLLLDGGQYGYTAAFMVFLYMASILDGLVKSPFTPSPQPSPPRGRGG